MSRRPSVVLFCGVAFLFGATALMRAGGAQAPLAGGVQPPATTSGQTEPQEQALPPGTYAPSPERTCLRQCHDLAPVKFILNTPHAVKGDGRTPFAEHQCETCHGASPEHVVTSSIPVAVVYKGPKVSPAAQRNQMCLRCHESGLRIGWRGSRHQREDLACNSCHTIHAEKDPVLVKLTQSQKCFTCHAEQRAQANRQSHHPIIEGKVVCADCHNPHGSPQDKMLVRNRVNDTCYKCHPEKRGPYLSEHAPVREDCTLCHAPHGSTQARLLKERPPYLCQQCHDTSHHSSSPYGGNTYIGGRTPAAQVSGRGCLNCHSQVHGSNSPSGVYNLR